MEDSLVSQESDPEWDMPAAKPKSKRGRGRGRSRGCGKGQADVTNDPVEPGTTRGRRQSTRRGRASGTMFDFLSGPESSTNSKTSKTRRRGSAKTAIKTSRITTKPYVKPPRNEVIRVGDCSTSEEEDTQTQDENVPSSCDFARESIERTCSPLTSLHGDNSCDVLISDSVLVGAVTVSSNGIDLVDSVQSNSNDLVSDSNCVTVIGPNSNCVTEDDSNVLAVLPENENADKEITSSEPTPGPSSVTPPKPVLKKKATKRGLAKKASDISVNPINEASKTAASGHPGHQAYSRPVNLKSIYARKDSTEETSDKDAATPTYTMAPSSKCSSALTVSSTMSSESRLLDDDLDDLDRSDDELSLSQATPKSSKKGAYCRAKAAPITRPRREPTPPPELDHPPAKKSKLNRQLTKAFNSLVSAQSTLGTMVTPSPPFRPGRKGKKKHEMRHFSDVLVDEDSPKRVDMPVKVRYLSKIHRIDMKLVDQFQVLVHQLSSILGEAAHQLNLYLRDQPLGLRASPGEVNLTVADIIDCYCIRPSTLEPGHVDPADSIQLIIQCSHTRTKVPMTFHKRRPLSELLQQYATQMTLQVDTLSMQFDGDQVHTGDTCTTLDMDEGDVLDVIMAGGT